VACTSDDVCHNNGTCVTANESSVGHHYCMCQPQWTGVRCQTQLTDIPAHYTPVRLPADNVSCSRETCVHGVCATAAAAHHQSSASRCFCIPGQSDVSIQIVCIGLVSAQVNSARCSKLLTLSSINITYARLPKHIASIVQLQM